MVALVGREVCASRKTACLRRSGRRVSALLCAAIARINMGPAGSVGRFMAALRQVSDTAVLDIIKHGLQLYK